MTSRRTVLKSLAASSAIPFIPGMASRAFSAEGDTIRFAVAKPAGDLNPHVYNGLWGAQDLIFEPLIEYGEGGELEPGARNLVGSAGRAASLLRLKLREGVTFQDGAPWNAEAMKWNLDRWIHLDDHGWMNHVRLFDGLEHP